MRMHWKKERRGEKGGRQRKVDFLSTQVCLSLINLLVVLVFHEQESTFNPLLPHSSLMKNASLLQGDMNDYLTGDINFGLVSFGHKTTPRKMFCDIQYFEI